jgi:hypothetical protein
LIILAPRPLTILGVIKTFFFRFLGFFEKNLKPKKCDLGGCNEKTQKKKGGFWKEMKSFRKESVLIFYK